MCTHCNRSGHTIYVCYRKYGFPPNFSKKQVFANASNVLSGDGEHLVNNGEEGVPRKATNKTQEQYSKLISLLQQTNLMPHTQISNHTVSSSHISPYSTHFDHSSNENPGKSQVSIVSCSIHTKPKI